MARQSANEQAVKLAVAGRWREAAAVNRELIARFGDDAEVYNRLGKAFTELGKIHEARLVYEKALAVDPTNAIAQRNLKRLAQAKEEEPSSAPATQISRGLFIEDVGKAAVARLEAGRPDALGALDAGDPVELEVRGNAINAVTPGGRLPGDGGAAGGPAPCAADRWGKPLLGGAREHRGAAAHYRAGGIPGPLPGMGKVSFPRSSISDVRAYTRRDFRRENVEDLTEDEDGPAEETPAADALPEDGWQETQIYEDDEGDTREDEDDDELD